MKVTDRQNMEPIDSPSASKSGSVKRKNVGSSSKATSPDKVRDELNSAKVNLSDRAQDMKKIRAAVDSAPDVDEAKIAKFKSLLAKGDYKVDAKAVADKMVDEHAYNDFIGNSEE